MNPNILPTNPPASTNLSKFITTAAMIPPIKKIGLANNDFPKSNIVEPNPFAAFVRSSNLKSLIAPLTPCNPVCAAPKSKERIDEPIIPKELFNLSNGSPAKVFTPLLKSPTLSVKSPSCFCTLLNSAVPSGSRANSSRSDFICALKDCVFSVAFPCNSNSNTTLLSAIENHFN